MAQNDYDNIEVNRQLLRIHGEVAKVTALNEKMQRGESDRSDKATLGLMTKYLRNISEAANLLPDDVEQEMGSGEIYLDNVRQWSNRISSGQLGDDDIAAIADDVIPALAKGVNAAMDIRGKAEPDPDAMARQAMAEAEAVTPKMRDGVQAIRADGTAQMARGSVENPRPVRADGQRSGSKPKALRKKPDANSLTRRIRQIAS